MCNIGACFKGRKEGPLCSLGDGEEETWDHILKCSKLNMNAYNVNLDQLYKENPENTAIKLQQILKDREKLK